MDYTRVIEILGKEYIGTPRADGNVLRGWPWREFREPPGQRLAHCEVRIRVRSTDRPLDTFDISYILQNQGILLF